MITASTTGFVDAALRQLSHGQAPEKIAWLTETLQSNLDPYCLTMLAKLAFRDPAYLQTLHNVYTVTLDGNGQKQLTGNDNNALSMDRLLLESIPHFIATASGNPWPIQWRKHKQDLFHLPDLDDFLFGYVGHLRMLNIVDKNNTGQAGIDLTFGAIRIPLVTEITNVDLQTRLVDLLIATVAPQVNANTGT
jgi:hypothetical protein